MRQTVFFPWLVETERLHSELSIYNPFTLRTRLVASVVKHPPDVGFRYDFTLRDRAGQVRATHAATMPAALSVHRLPLAGLLAAETIAPPFRGSAMLGYELDDERFAARARLYVQARLDLYDAGGACVLTDHGLQSASSGSTVIHGEVSVDERTDTGLFLLHTGSTPDAIEARLELWNGGEPSPARPLAVVARDESVWVRLGGLLATPKLVAAVVRVTQSVPGVLSGQHFKLDAPVAREIFA